jgi:hypothetical protein
MTVLFASKSMVQGRSRTAARMLWECEDESEGEGSHGKARRMRIHGAGVAATAMVRWEEMMKRSRTGSSLRTRSTVKCCLRRKEATPGWGRERCQG